MTSKGGLESGVKKVTLVLSLIGIYTGTVCAKDVLVGQVCSYYGDSIFLPTCSFDGNKYFDLGEDTLDNQMKNPMLKDGTKLWAVDGNTAIISGHNDAAVTIKTTKPITADTCVLAISEQRIHTPRKPTAEEIQAIKIVMARVPPESNDVETREPPSPPQETISITDINGDGLDDAIVSGNTFAILMRKGKDFQAAYQAHDWRTLGFSLDIDGDGKLELFTATQFSGCASSEILKLKNNAWISAFSSTSCQD
jgi:hypothetical protein